MSVASVPSMFEKLFEPWLAQQYKAGGNTFDKLPQDTDPVDQCFKDLFSDVIKSKFPDEDVEALHDFEMREGSDIPKVLVQTAGHMAGYAYYYQRKDVQPDPWDKDKKMYGVFVHPRYGGWFAFRGVLIFKGLLAPELKQRDPVDCVSSWEKRKELLQEYNFNWQEWKYRDVIDGEVAGKYSEEQKRYFRTPTHQRFDSDFLKGFLSVCYSEGKVNKGNLGHSFDFLVLLHREDGYLKANTIELTFTQCASNTANLMQPVASYERWETFSLI